MSAATPEAALTAELSNLRGDVGGISRDISDIKTACAVLVERSNRTEQDVKELRREYDERLAVVERRVWTASGVAGALGAVGGVLVALLGP
ncbi:MULTISPECIES: hypothetical protein [Actinomycetes]|uniref:hypothetical protein n=1 Tax=Actinomycetes TaxID=1760 RepID=UPI0033D93129